MTDTQKDSQQSQNAIVFIDGIPQFELAAGEIVYPIPVTDEDGNEARIFAHLSPYEPRELKSVLARVMPSFKTEGRMMTTEPGDRAAYRELVKAHFTGLSNIAIDEDGTEAPEEIKRDFFLRNPAFQERIATEGFGGVTLGHSEDAGAKPSGKLLILPTRSDVLKVPTWQKFVDAEGAEVRVDFEHAMTKESAGHRSRYDSATKNEMNTRTQETRFGINYDVLENLYNELATGAKGFAIHGQPCAADNKDEWVRLVPLWHKLQVTNHQFDRTSVKN